MSSYERRHPAPVASSAAALPPAARASKAPDPARAVERPSEESVAARTVPPTPAHSAPSSFVRSQTPQASPSQTLAAAYPLLRRENSTASTETARSLARLATNKDSEIAQLCNAAAYAREGALAGDAFCVSRLPYRLALVVPIAGVPAMSAISTSN